MSDRFTALAYGLSILISAAPAFAAAPSQPTASMPAQSAPAGRPPTLAVLADSAMGLDKSPLVALLEANLSQNKNIRLVERQEIDKVLAEQTLQMAFSADATSKRSKLGQLLKADLLVFLQNATGKDSSGLLLTVAETRHGLRLVMEPAIWQPDRAESICEQFAQGVRRACNLAKRQDLKVIAVAPFECRDLALDSEQRRRGYAGIVEQHLMAQPGLAVVELAEARALGREVAIGGQQVTRDLPYYIFGAYRTSGTGSARRVSITIELRRREQLVAQAAREDVAVAAAGQALQDAAAHLLSKILDPGTTPAPAKLETRVLVERGDTFAGMAEWDQALPLYESALLLDSACAPAHLAIMRGCTALMREGSPGMFRQSHVRVDYAARMRYAESFLDHLEVLFLQRPFALTTVDSRGHQARGPASSDLLSGVIEQLSSFRGQFWIGLDYDRASDPQGAYGAYQQACNRQAELLLRAIADQVVRAAVGNARLAALAQAAMYSACDQQRSRQDQKAIETIERLLGLLDEHSQSLVPVILSRYVCSGVNERHVNALLDCLEKSASQRVQLGVRVGRALQSVKDEAALRKARTDLTTLADAGQLPPQERNELLKLADQRLADWQALARRLDRQASRPAGVPIIPRLNPLRLTANPPPGSGQPQQVTDWLVCRPDLEVVATDVGVFRVEGGDRLTPIWRYSKRWSGAMQLEWDGRYVWAVTKPKGSLLVFDPQAGLLARFDQDDMPQGVGQPQGELATVAPGRACFFGYYHPESPVFRNYATLLSIEPGSDATKSEKHAETFFESRQARADGQRKQIASRQPAWAMTVTGDSPTSRPAIVVGGAWDRPLLIDPLAKTVTELKGSWPANARLIEHDGWLYVGSGGVAMRSQQSSVYRTDSLGHAPELLVDFGERPFLGSTFTGGPYYRSMVVFENQLHLLASRNDFFGRTPVWVAVDLDSRRAHRLADDWPEDLRKDRRQSLVVSPRYGLLLLTDGRLFRVELPPRAEWPVKPNGRGAPGSTSRTANRRE